MTMKGYSTLKGSLILRDYLALDRTVLANERTLLSYFRLVLGLVSIGAGMVGILDFLWTTILGYMFIGVGSIALIIGIVRYRSVKKKLKAIQDIADDSYAAGSR
jgi:putative membrane protein